MMAFLRIFGLLGAIFFTACSKQSLKENIVLEFGDSTVQETEMLFYDTSAHLLCLTKNYPQFEKYFTQPGKFKFRQDNQVLFQGDIWPAALSSLPPSNYTSIINLSSGVFYLEFNRLFDRVEDEKLIKALSFNNKTKNGLAIQITNIQIKDSTLTYDALIVNRDTDTLLILDGDKMGLPLLYYFTGFPTLYNLENKQPFSLGTSLQVPDSMASFKFQWLTPLAEGQHKSISYHYKLAEIPAGKYELTLGFSGPNYQITMDQMWQPNGRIWIGQIKCTAPVLIL